MFSYSSANVTLAGPMLGVLVTIASMAASHAEMPVGFTPLFNGKDLSGWQGVVADPNKRAAMSTSELRVAQKIADEKMHTHWKAVNGQLEFDGTGESIGTVKEYGDFEVYVDWKILPKGDSGIYLRGVPQVQIWDPDDESLFKYGADKGSGGLWNNKKNERFPLLKADKPIGEWNTFYIKMIGDRVTVKLNDKLVVDNVTLENYWNEDKPIPARGQIELQNHGNKLWFRNLFISEISSPSK